MFIRFAATMLFLTGAFGSPPGVRRCINIQAIQIAPGVKFPYDLAKLRLQTASALNRDDGGAACRQPGDVLEVEVLDWHAGNEAERLGVGGGTGRESAKIHYTLSDPNGTQIFARTDTIRAAFWFNAYHGSVGQLAKPLADKIAHNLKEAGF